MSGDRVIRFGTAAVVCAVAVFAAVVSYSHIYGLGRAHGAGSYAMEPAGTRKVPRSSKSASPRTRHGTPPPAAYGGSVPTYVAASVRPKQRMPPMMSHEQRETPLARATVKLLNMLDI